MIAAYILQNQDIFYRANVNLKPYNTFAIKSVAGHFYIVASVQALATLKKYFEQNKQEYIVLGAGSNIVFTNKYINTNIIYTGLLNNIKIDGNKIIAQCGVYIPNLVGMAYANALSGLEFLSCLPASVGGATFMNARCYGSEMSHIIESVGIIDEHNAYREIAVKDCCFEYKKSVFQDNKYIIVNAVFNLIKIETEIELKKSKEKILFYKNDRIRKSQFAYPCAGSVFLNDYSTNMIAGKVIDSVKMRGAKYGGAKVLPTHANFIVNYNDATGQDVIMLTEKIKNKVLNKTGIQIHSEIHFY